MQIFLVGGAVRDELLGLQPRERDWLVVGAHSEELLAQGYIQVGKHFPVFLHPETHEEYALARTERKTGPGHTGFEVDAHAEVTLEQDLRRRDLTINAMARGSDGVLVDPYSGLQDLQGRILRHVSEAFSEDPLRVFRTARFYARFIAFGFSIAQETQQLLSDMAKSGVLQQISAERIWQEFRKSLVNREAQGFITALKSCGALTDWFPELQAIDLSTLEEIWSTIDDAEEDTHKDTQIDWQKYTALGSLLSTEAATALSERLRVPKTYRQSIVHVSKYALSLKNWKDLSDELLLETVSAMGALKQSSSFAQVLKVISMCCQQDHSELQGLVDALNKIRVGNDARFEGQKGAALGKALHIARVELLHTNR